MNATANTMAAEHDRRAEVALRPGTARRRRAAMPSTGSSVRAGSCISSWRVASRSAQASSTASFRNSLGWKLIGPSATHALASLT